MLVNITIIIQIANFLIAYSIIRTFLLKPVVSIILQEEEHQATLLNTINKNTKENKAKEELMTQRWICCKQEFSEHAPQIAQIKQTLIITDTVETEDIPVFNNKTVDPIAHKLADEIVERINHVR